MSYLSIFNENVFDAGVVSFSTLNPNSIVFCDTSNNLNSVNIGSGLSFTNGTLSTSGIVTSITGTNNQIFANGTYGTAKTGDITLSLPQDISTISTPTFAGLNVEAGYITTSSFAANLVNQYIMNLGGSIGGTVLSTGFSGLKIDASFVSSVGISTVNLIELYPKLLNSGTVTTLCGLYVNSATKGSGAVTNAYGGYFTDPGIGTNKIALYSDNLNIGYAGVSPPTGNGAIIKGNVGIGKNSASVALDVTGDCNISGNITFASLSANSYVGTDINKKLISVTSPTFTSLTVSGLTPNSLVATDGSSQLTSSVSGLSPSFSGLSVAGYVKTSSFTASLPTQYIMNLSGNIGSYAGSTGFVGLKIDPYVFTSVNVSSINTVEIYPRVASSGSITNMCGLIVFGATKGTNTITNAYGGYFVTPTVGTSNAAVYTDNLNCGYPTVSPPSGGAVFSGNVGIGQNSATYKLDVTGTARFNHLYLTSNYTVPAGTDIESASLAMNHTLTSMSSCNWLYGIYNAPSFVMGANLPAGTANLRIVPSVTGAFTAQYMYGIRIDPMSKGTSTVTYAYGAYIYNPGSIGSSCNVALYADNMSIGVNNTTPPSSGLLVSGNVKINSLGASGLVATDASSNLTTTISGLSPAMTGLTLSGLGASSLVATDGSSKLTTTTSGISPTFTGLTLSGSLTLNGATANTVLCANGSKVLSYSSVLDPAATNAPFLSLAGDRSWIQYGMYPIVNEVYTGERTSITYYLPANCPYNSLCVIFQATSTDTSAGGTNAYLNFMRPNQSIENYANSYMMNDAVSGLVTDSKWRICLMQNAFQAGWTLNTRTVTYTSHSVFYITGIQSSSSSRNTVEVIGNWRGWINGYNQTQFAGVHHNQAIASTNYITGLYFSAAAGNFKAYHRVAIFGL